MSFSLVLSSHGRTLLIDLPSTIHAGNLTEVIGRLTHTISTEAGVLKLITEPAVCGGGSMSAGLKEVVDGEAGDDRQRAAEIARLYEIYNIPPTEERVPGPADIRFSTASKVTGHLILNRQHIRPAVYTERPGPELYLG